MSRAQNAITLSHRQKTGTNPNTISFPTFSLCSICCIGVQLLGHKSSHGHCQQFLIQRRVHLKTIKASPQWKPRRLICPRLIGIAALHKFLFRQVLDVAYLTIHVDAGAMAFTQRKYLLPRLAAKPFWRDKPKHTTQHSQVIRSLFVDHLNSVT